MGYPSGIQTFTNKNPGDPILDTHIDDLQAEVTAIETDLINGMTGPFIANNGLTAGNSTVAALQLTGNLGWSTQTYVPPSSRATVGDILTVASTSGSTATLQWQPGTVRPVCLLRHSAVTQIPQSAFTGLNWDTEDANDSGMHSTSANSSRITFAASTGTYQVGLSVFFGGGAGTTGGEVASIRLNDTIGIAGGMTFHGQASASKPLTVTALLQVTSTADYVTAVVNPGSISTGRVLDSTASTISGPRFWAHKVG